jgi:hypothetical protein
MVPPTGIVLPRISPSAVAAQQPRNSVVGGNTIITNNARISNSGRNRPAAAEGGGGKQQRTSSAGGGNKAITDQQRRDETDDSINQVSTLIVKRDIDGLKLWQTAKKKILKYLQDRAIYQMVRRFIREQSCSTQIENGILLRHRAKTKDPIVQIVPRVLTVAATDPQILSGGSYRPSQAPGSNIQRFLAIDRQGTVWTFDYDLQQLRSEYMQFHLPSVYMDAQHQSFSIYRTRIRIECDQFQLMELRPTVYCAVSLENRAIRFYDARLELLLTFPVPHPVVKLQATVGDMVAVQSTCRLDIFKVTIKALQTQTLVKVKPHLIISPDLLPDQWILDFTICKHQSRLYILTHSHMFVSYSPHTCAAVW